MTMQNIPISDKEATQLESGIEESGFFLEILEAIHEPISIINRKYKTVYANRAATEEAGKSLPEILSTGRCCFEDYKGSKAVCPYCVVGQVFNSNAAAYNTFNEVIDGKNVLKEISAFPLRNKNGEVTNVIEVVRDISNLNIELQKRAEFSSIISEDEKMKSVFEMMELVAPTDSTVLITGETGVGKELVARAIHTISKRKAKKFIAINCGALPDSLLESELFGHEKGAFTGADSKRIGKFEAAHEGTLFLDELGSISQAMQVKILRALQEGEITRVGGNEQIKVDVRYICATNSDLAKAVKSGEFREDLFYRVNVMPIHIPPLRERPVDIELIAYYFLKKFNEAIGKSLRGFSSQTINAMRRYEWPGNVRELRNLVERAFILSKGSFIERMDIPSDSAVVGTRSIGMTLKEVGEQAEKEYLTKVLESYHGNINQTAEHADVNTRTIHRKMRDYDIQKEEFKR